MYGWNGCRLRVDLSKGKVKEEDIDPGYARKWIGGRGFNSERLYRETEAGIDPLGPKNKLLVGVGPLSGTYSPGSGRTTFTAMSPLAHPTGHGDANVGGHWGPELKYAGFDQIIFEGKADEPTYMWIDDGDVELREAPDMWGATIREADDMMREAVGDDNIRTALIGPAGENLVRFANVMIDRKRAAGRTGMGAVMGSKNLKGIGVRGFGSVDVYDAEKFRDKVDQLKEEKYEGDPMVDMLYDVGTMLLTRVQNEQGWFCNKNFQLGFHPDFEKVLGETHRDNFLERREGCFSCDISCGRVSKAEVDGEEIHTSGPEHETMTGLGPRMGTLDFPRIIKNTKMADNLGMDSLSLGGAIAWAMESYENGILEPEDADGYDLTWGNHEAMEGLIEDIAYREGFGDTLAEGCLRAAKEFDGGYPYTMTIKGVTMPTDDARGIGFAFALNYAISHRGADHLHALPCSELTGRFYPGMVEKRFGTDEAEERLTTVKKPEMVRWHEKYKAAIDSLTMCYFHCSWSFAMQIEDVAELYKYATGVDADKDDLLEVGDRILSIERANWNRNGIGCREDTLPKRFTETPMPAGPNEGVTTPLDEMLPKYYELAEWDPDTGFVSEEKLERLGLKDVAEDLEEPREEYKEKEGNVCEPWR